MPLTPWSQDKGVGACIVSLFSVYQGSSGISGSECSQFHDKYIDVSAQVIS